MSMNLAERTIKFLSKFILDCKRCDGKGKVSDMGPCPLTGKPWVNTKGTCPKCGEAQTLLKEFQATLPHERLPGSLSKPAPAPTPRTKYVITRVQTTCAKCKESIPKDTEVWWTLSKGKGKDTIHHIDCLT